ncbi:restriction endonuclease [Mesoplasma florum]|uniref:restriction endonuclease n=1 Tax=Mesoplasma florum TaxID=2151 RepID=UPI000BE33D61|nr:restriction endonuclease [Mesoplasma florum]ATI73940.1 restriction endonuclease [Mesoplasma florum]
MEKINRNDLLLEIMEITESPTLEEFLEKTGKSQDFKFLCNVMPNIEKERLEIENAIPDFLYLTGIVYIFVYKNHVMKIGQTITNFRERINSYNCGKKKNREKGTASTTNYFILQSILALNEQIDVYYFKPDLSRITLWGKEYVTSSSSSKLAEGIIVNEYMNIFGKKPVGNSQK